MFAAGEKLVEIIMLRISYNSLATTFVLQLKRTVVMFTSGEGKKSVHEPSLTLKMGYGSSQKIEVQAEKDVPSRGQYIHPPIILCQK